MLTVRELMRSDVVSVPRDISVRRLARLLSDTGISGCPVVDETEKVVGVVSATDVMRLAAEESDVHLAAATVAVTAEASEEDDEGEGASEPDAYFLPEDPPRMRHDAVAEVLESELDSTTASDIMTPVTYSVQPDVGVVELAQFLVRGGIHRALVVEDGRLLGIVTSHDVLGAVADGRIGA